MTSTTQENTEKLPTNLQLLSGSYKRLKLTAAPTCPPDGQLQVEKPIFKPVQDVCLVEGTLLIALGVLIHPLVCR
jgi:hypothetical protein